MTYVITVLLSVISGVLVFLVKNLLADNRRLRNERRTINEAKQSAIMTGVTSLLRIQLIEYHDNYMTGSIPTYVYENWCEMYDAYKKLGGNGLIDHMKEDIDHLMVANN